MSAFQSAILRASIWLWQKKWYGASWLVWELVRDRAAEWANRKIDETSGGALESLAEFVRDWLSYPVGWAAVLAIAVLLGLLLHSYVMEHRAGTRESVLIIDHPRITKKDRTQTDRANIPPYYYAVMPTAFILVLIATLGGYQSGPVTIVETLTPLIVSGLPLDPNKEN